MSTENELNKDVSMAVRDVVFQNRGGKEVIARILSAYGFSSRISLCKQLGVSQSTMANRYARDTFPADWVIICHLETNASLVWLSTGKGSTFVDGRDERTTSIRQISITNGKITSLPEIIVDRSTIPSGLSNPFIVGVERSSYFVDTYEGEIVDGYWLVEIDNLISIREIYRFPGGKLRIENGKASFECTASEINVLGKVISKTEFMDF